MRAFSAVLALTLAFAVVRVAPGRGASAVTPDAAAIEGKGRALQAAAAKRLPVADTRQADFDVLDYDNQLLLDPADQEIWGWTAITFRGAPGRLASQLVLDFVDSMTVLRVADEGGVALSHAHAGDLLTVPLPSPLAETDTTIVHVYFHGHPRPYGFLGFGFTTSPDGAPLAATLSEPWSARSWWPCKDVPTDKATFTARLLVPTGLTAVSNGVRLAEEPPRTSPPESPGGRDLGWDDLVPPHPGFVPFWWREQLPLSTYHFSVPASRYVELHDTWGDLPLTHYVYPSQAAAARADFAAVPAMLDFCSEMFGPFPFPQQKFGLVSFEWDGAMEHPTATSWGSVLLTGDGRYETIVLHELAHEWFGNQVTCADWTDSWLNEGFATYAEALWAERRHGGAALRNFMQQREWFSVASGPLVRLPGNPSPWYYFHDIVYHKGAWVLHMLRRELGDEAFLACLRAWVDDPARRYGTATSADFERVCEQTSGTDLGWFFDQWLHRSGGPVLAVEYIGDDSSCDIRVRQMQPADPINGELPYRLSIDLRLAGTGFADTVTVGMTDRDQSWHLRTRGRVTALQVDPASWLFNATQSVTHLTGAGDAPAAAVARLLPPFPNPLASGGTIRWETTQPTADALVIHDLRGRRVAQRSWAERPAGPRAFAWNGRDDRGRPCPAGVYIIGVECAPGAQAKAAGGVARLRGRVTLAR